MRSKKPKCCVLKCKNTYENTSNKNLKVKFYSFTSSINESKQDLRKKWINAVKRIV